MRIFLRLFGISAFVDLEAAVGLTPEPEISRRNWSARQTARLRSGGTRPALPSASLRPKVQSLARLAQVPARTCVSKT